MFLSFVEGDTLKVIVISALVENKHTIISIELGQKKITCLQLFFLWGTCH